MPRLLRLVFPLCKPSLPGRGLFFFGSRFDPISWLTLRMDLWLGSPERDP